MNLKLGRAMLDDAWVRVVGLLLYAIVSYMLSMYAIAEVVTIANQLGAGWEVQTTVGTLVLRCVVYALTILLLLGALRLGPHRLSWKSVGFAKDMGWKDVGLGVVGFLGYGLLAMLVLFVISHLPGYDANQSQDVGISSVYGLERMAAFVVLVIIVPLSEEFMFRGLLYGRLRQERMPWWIPALIVSALFGLAHGQWNVGIDVFCLSMVACALRELTGTIWAGVLLHVIKNFIAFTLLFVLAQG